MLLLAYGLRLFGLTSESLWIDEGYSLALAKHNVLEIVQGTAADQHPPFYYMLLHLWLLIGQSVFQLRYLSVLIGVASIALGARIGRAMMAALIGLLIAMVVNIFLASGFFDYMISVAMVLVFSGRLITTICPGLTISMFLLPRYGA